MFLCNQIQNSYQYAIAVYNGYRTYKYEKELLTGQEVCSLIACTTINSTESCAQRYQSDVHQRYRFDILKLETVLPMRKMTIMSNTLTTSILPLNATQFDFQKYVPINIPRLLELNKIFSFFVFILRVKSEDGKKYVVSLALLQSRSDLLTFAIFSRDYSKDMFRSIGIGSHLIGLTPLAYIIGFIATKIIQRILF